MDEQALKRLAGAVNLPEAVPPNVSGGFVGRPKAPELDRSVHPPALTPSRRQPAGEHHQALVALHEAVGNMPTKWWRAGRRNAREYDCEEELTAIEDAIDAVVSARE